jgi:hypothetical protein
MEMTLTAIFLQIAIVGLPLGLVSLYLRAIRQDVHRFQEGVIRRLDDHESRIQNVEQHKVGHKDWVRVEMSQQRNLEVTRELLRELSGKIDASLGITGSLGRLATALERKTEAPA